MCADTHRRPRGGGFIPRVPPPSGIRNDVRLSKPEVYLPYYSPTGTSDFITGLYQEYIDTMIGRFGRDYRPVDALPRMKRPRPGIAPYPKRVIPRNTWSKPHKAFPKPKPVGYGTLRMPQAPPGGAVASGLGPAGCETNPILIGQSPVASDPINAHRHQGSRVTGSSVTQSSSGGKGIKRQSSSPVVINDSPCHQPQKRACQRAAPEQGVTAHVPDALTDQEFSTPGGTESPVENASYVPASLFRRRRTEHLPELPEFKTDPKSAKHVRNKYKKLMRRGYLADIESVPCAPGVICQDEIRFVYRKAAPVILGSGSYGCVFLGRLNGKLVAIKLFKKCDEYLYDNDSTAISQIFQEAVLNTYANQSPATTHCHGLVRLTHSRQYYEYGLVMDFLGHRTSYKVTSLFDLLKSHMLSDMQWKNLLVELCDKLHSLHSIDIILNDLKTDNILVQKINNKWQPFLIDLGLARYKAGPSCVGAPSSDPAAAGFLLTYTQVAPEQVYNKHCCTKSDIYSLGTVINTIRTECSLDLSEIVSLCHQVDPESRPSAVELAHMFATRSAPHLSSGARTVVSCDHRTAQLVRDFWV